jgi:hypothetical protein
MRIRKTTIIPDDLECGVIPQGTFLQKLARLFRPQTAVFKPLEKRIGNFQHRLELLRTLATLTNMMVSILVLLKVFKVI